MSVTYFPPLAGSFRNVNCMKMKTMSAVFTALLMTGIAGISAVGATVSTQTQQISGPGTLDVEGVGSLGIGLCNDQDPGGQGIGNQLPLWCTGVGFLQGQTGAAAFDASTYAAVDQTVSTTVTYVAGSGLEGVGGAGKGFYVLLCNDRDLDSNCTNVAVAGDQLVSTVTSGSSATVAMCAVQPLPPPITSGAWSDGSFVVFIGAYASTAPAVGATIGLFDVSLTNDDTACTPNASEAPTEPTICLNASFPGDPMGINFPGSDGSVTFTCTNSTICGAGTLQVIAAVAIGLDMQADGDCNGTGASADTNTGIGAPVADADAVAGPFTDSFTCVLPDNVGALGVNACAIVTV